MPRPYSHPDIRIHYQTLINRGFEDICEHSIQRAVFTKHNIGLLLHKLSLKEKTDEFITMEINLTHMSDSLSLLLAFKHLSNNYMLKALNIE